MGFATIHKKDIVLNKKKFEQVMFKRGHKYISLYNKIVDDFGLDLTYKSFMGLTDNRSSWKLLYAYSVIKELNIELEDVFELIDVDVDKKIKEKEKWKEKYQK